MTRIELIGWCIVIAGVIANTIMNLNGLRNTKQNQQILIDELEALRKELKAKKD
mgnify:FL=1